MVPVPFWESISTIVVATCVTLCAEMISRAASTDPSIKITRIGRTSANSVAAMAWRADQNCLSHWRNLAAGACVGRTGPLRCMSAPRIGRLIRFVLESRGGRDEFNRLSLKTRRYRGQPNRNDEGHRIKDLQINIITD